MAYLFLIVGLILALAAIVLWRMMIHADARDALVDRVLSAQDDQQAMRRAETQAYLAKRRTAAPSAPDGKAGKR